MKSALVIGATGLTGRYLVNELLNDDAFSSVTCIVRRSSFAPHPKLKELIGELSTLATLEKEIKTDVVFCTIGTTIKKAGSQEAFTKVDYEYPLQVARMAKQSGAGHFLLMSSLGANSASGNFYLKTKGNIEDVLKALQFESLSVFRPSILLGPRAEFRLGEKIGIFFMRLFSFLMIGSIKKYRPIHVKQVAHAMVVRSKKSFKGLEVFESDGIEAIK